MPEINKTHFWAPTAEAAIAHADDLIYAGVSPEAVSITKMISWGAGDQQPRITIHNDGRVELAGDITLGQASREFWDAVQEMGIGAIARVRELHRKETHGPDCAYCVRGNNGTYDVTWPCDTIRALDGQAS